MPLTRPMLMALAAAFLSMGVVLAAKTFSDTIFLAEFGVAYVPHFFVLQAAGIIAASTGYGALLRRVSSPPLDIAILGMVAASAVAGLWAADAGGAAVFLVSLAMSVLPTAAFFVMWNAATAVVSGRRSRRFLPLAGAAATGGAVVASFGATAVVGGFGIANLAPIIAGMTVLMAILRVLLVSRSSEWHPPPRPQVPRTRALAERTARRDALLARTTAKMKRAGTRATTRTGPTSDANPDRRLVLIMSVATLVEACLTAFVDFGFKLEVANAMSGRTQIGVYLSMFYGAANAVLLGLQMLASSRLLATKSLRFSLALEPTLLLLASVAWMLFPTLALATVARGTEGIMKFSVARPAQEVALTPLTEVERKRWKVLLRGVYNQAGGAAAGLLLIAAAPWLGIHSKVVPVAAALTALAWLLLQLATSNRYLDTLGSALGLRRMSLRDDRAGLLIDRDGLARVVQLCGSSDETTARFGRELLATYAQDPRLLVPYIGMGPAAQRETLYRLLAGRPHKSCAPSLRAAMMSETGGDPAAACLDALAAHDDRSMVARARELAGEGLPHPDGEPDGAARLSVAAWRYLAQVGALDETPEQLQAMLAATLAHDGARAAEILRALVARGTLAREQAEDLTLAAAGSPDESRMRQGLHAGAGIGGARPLGRVLEALAGRAVWLDEIVAHMEPDALNQLLGFEAYRHVPTRVRARVLRGLRSSELAEVGDLVGRELVDPDPVVRELAARTMLRRARDHGEVIPRYLAERALSLQLDRFEIYVRARPGYASAARESHIDVKYRAGIMTAADLTAEAFFIDELERRTERSLTRLCAVLALFGNPSSVFAAERALRAPTFKLRRQALDIMQEVARGRDRTRLLQLLELYLLPREPAHGARQRVCDLDPWLARCASFSADPMMQRLWALRSTLLFDDIEGELLDMLAVRSSEIEHGVGEVVVAAGEPADALYVVMKGVVAVERDGKVVAQVGRGQAFGELSLLDGLPRQATVRSEKPSRFLRLPRDTFDEAMNEHPEIGLGLVRGLVRWLRQGEGVPRQY